MIDRVPDQPRAWILAGRILIVTLLAVVAVLTISGVSLALIVLVGLAIGMSGSVLLSPDRPWWGPEPRKLLSDPVRMAAYRKREIRFLLAAFLVAALALPLALGFLSSVLTR